MWYVYILRSQSTTAQTYIGVTHNLKQRFVEHNTGRSCHTAKFMPWSLEWYAGFPQKQSAYAFEKYLKSHSGKAFTKKRLLQATD